MLTGGRNCCRAFKASDPRTKDKLRRISGLRGIDIFVCGPTGAIEKLEPRHPVVRKAVFCGEIPDLAYEGEE